MGSEPSEKHWTNHELHLTARHSATCTTGTSVPKHCFLTLAHKAMYHHIVLGALEGLIRDVAMARKQTEVAFSSDGGHRTGPLERPDHDMWPAAHS